LILPCLVNAKDIKVPGDYEKIQDAIDHASDGDVILVGYGHYYEYLNIEKSITIRGIGNTYIHCPDKGKSPFRNPNAVVNIADNMVTLELVKIYGFVEMGDLNPNMHYGIDALNAMVTVDKSSIYGIQKGSIKAKGGSLDVIHLSFDSRTINDERVAHGFVLDDVGAVTCKKLFCEKGNVKTLFSVNQTYTGARESTIFVKQSKLGDVVIDEGREGSYKLYLDQESQKFYDDTQKDISSTKYTTSISPVLHYRFDGNLKDVSTAKNDGVAMGSPKYVTDIWGQPNMALHFQKEGQVDALKLKDFNKYEFSYSFWYSNVSGAGEIGGILRAYFPGKEGSTISITQRKSKQDGMIMLCFYALERDGSSDKHDAYKTFWGCVELDKEWHHIAFTGKAGSSFKIYVDGQLEVEKASTEKELLRIPTQLQIGSTDKHGAENTLGCYDDLRVFNRELSENEVKDLASMNTETDEVVEDEGLIDLVPMPDMEDPAETGTASLAGVPVADEEESMSPSGISFDPEQVKFKNEVNGNKHEFTLPGHLQYQSHVDAGDHLLIAYYDTKNKLNYLGIWSNKLEYTAEFKFAAIEVKSYDLYHGRDKQKYVLVHYYDTEHGTDFVGIFSAQNMQFLGQYEVSKKKNITLVTTKDNPAVSFGSGKKAKTVEFSVKGKFIAEY
jgi:hypothetical protein